MERRRFLQTASAVGVTAGVAGCTGFIGGGGGEGVEYWTLFGGGDGDVMESMVQEINGSDEHDVQINRQRVPFDEYYDRLFTALTGDEKPDLAVMHADQILQYEDLVSPMDEYVDTDPYVENLAQNGVRDGELLAVPLDTHPLGLYYNKDVFDEAGLDPENPPTSSDEFEEAADAIVGETDNWAFQYHSGGFAVDHLRMGMAARGGELLTDDFEPVFDNEDGVAVAETMHGWVHEHEWTPDDSDVGWEAWNRGDVGMITEGTWHIGVVRENPYDWGMTYPWVFGGDTPHTNANSHMLIVPQDENRDENTHEAAMEAARLLTQDYNTQWGTDAGHLPASEEALQSDELRESDTWDQTLSTFYEIVQEEQVVTPKSTPNNPAYNQEIYSQLDEMRHGAIGPEEAIQNAAEGVRGVFD